MQTQIAYFFLSPFPSLSKTNDKNTPFLCSFSSVSSLPHTHPTNKNLSLSNFLIETLAISEPQAISISNRFPWRKSMDNPQSVVHVFKQLGFSDSHIRSSIQLRPEILFSNVDKILKPKLQFFQDLGFTGPDLGNFISTHPRVLFYSLERNLIPCVDIVKKTLGNDKNNQDLIRVFQCTYSDPSVSRLKCNIAFLESCGIVGPHLSMLLKRAPWLFFISVTALRDQVSRVLDMGFSVDSRMFVPAVLTVGGMTRESFSRKIELLRSFGFSMDECMDMFRRAPTFLRPSVDKLKFKIDFFLNDLELDRCALVSWPNCLTYSIENRVIPRYRVLRVIMSKGLLQKEPSLNYVLTSSEEKFLGKLISRFPDDAEEILEIYNGDLLDS
ncbi:uncharacterized protein LOC131303938 isoform X1 [Rhododendron vialii]|uniref:uncharacterized protein LOC131303938 isoform X1 n=1 Tax=Rhododendron vialii TaxID=182163 RepID=UPI00266041A3|nr:uncharacterized protein LOC131303938 isoform X1 [Rhododendron vialii]XP_058186986.1 uncharacterized protein LOC131303938 isoform X1 [Rhododendron vialii]